MRRESRPCHRAASPKTSRHHADATNRNRLAQSILSHATPPTAVDAIDRALLALQVATIDDLLELMDTAS